MRPAATITEDERADRAINRAFESDASFPDLDLYLTGKQLVISIFFLALRNV